MLVDDESDILMLLKKGLEGKGIGVTAFSDPIDALRHFEANQNSIDMVVSDVRMSGMTGFQLAKAIRELQEEVRIVLISSFDVNKKEFESVLPSTRIDGFLTKPFHLNQLLEVIKQHD